MHDLKELMTFCEITNIKIPIRNIFIENLIELLNNKKFKFNINKFKLYKILTKKNNLDNKFVEINNLQFNQFLSKQIFNWILNNCNMKYKYENKYLNINIFSKGEITPKQINKFHNIIDFFNTITNNKKKIYLHIYLTPFKKILNKKLDVDTINSAATNKIEIWIWRKEEIFKVIFHELIHFINYDLINDEFISKKIKKIFNINSTVKLNEAYTEFVAVNLMSLFKAYRLKLKNNNNILDTYNKLIKSNICWSLYQTAKIIKNVSCFSKYEDFFNKSNLCYLEQDTSAFSYYIVKSALLFNMKYFFNEMIKMNQTDFKFNNLNKNYNNFYEIIIKSLKKEEFINIINKLLTLNYDKKKSMRMTIFI